MNPAKTSGAHAKAAPGPVGRPARRRPTDFRAEAVQFLSIALNALDAKGADTNTANLMLPRLFRNYSANTGLRGKEKESVWRATKLLFKEANESALEDASVKE